MKRYFILLLLSLLVAGCAKDMSADIYALDIWDPETQSAADTPIRFLSETDPSAWTRLGSLEERFAACSVPASILKEKTTEALGLSILHYPLNGILSAYNYLDSPVRMIYQNSPLHRELASRTDAAEVMAEIFKTVDVDPSVTYSVNYKDLSWYDEMFLEMFLGTRLIPGLDKGSDKETIKKAASQKLKKRMNMGDEESFGTFGLIPLAYMNERLGLGLSIPNYVVDTMHFFVVDR
jgi:hypothetical protein